MPVSFLSETERLRFNSFPADLSTGDLIAFFTLGESDLLQIPATASATNRLGFALQLLLLRFLGFHLPELKTLPATVVNYVASQIGAELRDIENYGERGQTRSDHQRIIERVCGYRQPSEKDFQNLNEWLLERALEHDRPTLLCSFCANAFKSTSWFVPVFPSSSEWSRRSEIPPKRKYTIESNR